MRVSAGSSYLRHVRSHRPGSSCFRRYAVLVNPTCSVDPVLGTAAPQPPTVRRGANDNKTDTLTYRQDIEFFPTMLHPDSKKASLESRRAQIERIKGSTTGSRQSATLPASSRTLADKLNEAINYWDEDPSMFQSPEKLAAKTDRAPGNQVQDLTGIKRVVISAAHQLLERSSSKPTTVAQFQHEMQGKINAQLSTTLPYEPMPKVDRKVNLTSAISTPEEITQAEDDGVLLICYVDCSVPEKESVSFCSGFAVQGGSSLSAEDSPDRGELVITCAHEMESAFPDMTDPNKGVILAMTRRGHMYPVQRLMSYMPNADLALFQLAEDAVQLDPATGQLRPVRDATLATLPVSPYPAVVDTELSVCSFGGWMPRGTGSTSDLIFQFLHEDVVRNRWVRATLVGYRDPIGRQAETGTYDELAQLDFILNLESPENPASVKDAAKVSSASFPMPGSSGGPVVDINTGSVVGIVRGQRSSELGDSRGDAVPAEKIFECTFEPLTAVFSLPGIGKRR